MKTYCVAVSILLSLLVQAPPVAADEVASGVLNESTLAQAALEDIGKINQALEQNLEQQEKAWPTREADQAKEMATPEAVQQLQVTQIKLERKRDRRLRDLQRFCESDARPILDALNKSQDRAFIDALIPVAVKVARNDPRLFKVLKRLEARFDVCPPSIVNGLADLGKEEASLSLLELGMKERNLSVLRSASKNGDPVVLSQLITAAESDDKELAKVCRQTIARLTPPSRPSSSLVGLLVQRIPEVRSSELKTSLIVYLGVCKSQESYAPLKKVYEEDANTRVRAAVISAMGNLDSEASNRFVLARIKKKSLPADLERACIHALGSARYRPAIPELIRLLDDRALKRASSRALQRISGQDFGEHKGPWLRWWRAQPEAKGFKDPDE